MLKWFKQLCKDYDNVLEYLATHGVYPPLSSHSEPIVIPKKYKKKKLKPRKRPKEKKKKPVRKSLLIKKMSKKE